MRLMLSLMLLVPMALVGCHLGGGEVETDDSGYELVSLSISGMT